MNETQLMFRLKQGLAISEKRCQALEELCMGMSQTLEMTASVACAWTWDFVFGNPELTDAEIREALRPAAPKAPEPKPVLQLVRP